MICVKNAKVVLENGILFDGVVLVEKDRIAAVGDAREVSVPENAEIVDAAGAYVGPGFVDIHVHGGGEAMFQDDPQKAAAHFLAHGETTQLATLYCTLTKEGFLTAIERIRAARQEGGAAKAIGGFYMEGPYMNPKYGASAAFNQWKDEIQEEDFREIVELAGKDAKVWVIAPEREGIERFMAYAKQVNPDVVFSVGHSEATPKQVEKVKKYGVRLTTHCMDATGRVPVWAGTRACGPDEACFLSDEIYAEMICDSLGVHVNPELQRLIIKVKGIDKLVLISDSFVSDLVAQEGLRHVTDLSFDENGDLSGSKLTMDVVCRNLMKHTNCGIAQPFLAASRNPARAVGMDDEIGSIEKGKKANLVLVDDTFHVKKVMLEGKWI